MSDHEEVGASVPPDGEASTGAAAADPGAPGQGEAPDAGAPPSSDLPPLLPTAGGKRKAKKAAKKGRGRPRKYATAAEEREARNQRLKEKRQVEAALAAAEAATRGTQPPAAEGEGKPGDDGGEAGNVTAIPAADPQLSAMIGLTAGLASGFVPPENGGGELSTEERKALGDAWAVYIGPKLGGAVSPLTQAIVTTVQVFAFRAFAYRHEQAKGKKRDSSADKAEAGEAPPVPPATRKPGVSPQPARGTNAAPKKKAIRLPLYTGAD